MAHTADPAAVVVDQETLIQGVAKHFLHKVFGPQGMPWGTKFSDLEELAVQIGQAVLPEHDGPGPCRPSPSRARSRSGLWGLRDHSPSG
ncbi:MAG: hypothetical protein ACXVBY_21120, partial [Isosphaeraceae bacterium]